MKRHLRTHSIPFEYDKRVFGKSTDVRIYRDATMISVGEFADSITMSKVSYSKDVLERTVNNVESNYLNLNHSHQVLDRVGRFVNPWFDGENVKADLWIYPVTQNARDTIELIDSGLINWLSTELITEDGYDRNNQIYVKDMAYIGLAVVTAPACKSSLIDDMGESPPAWMYE